MMEIHNIIRLSPWQEWCGIVPDIQENKDFAALSIGQKILAVPVNVGIMLRPFIGRRVALLRTDLADEPYIAILIDESGKVLGSPLSPKKYREEVEISWTLFHNLPGTEWSDDTFKNISVLKCINSHLISEEFYEQIPIK